MKNLVDFLTSREIIIVYCIAILSCIICFIVYLVERNNEKLRRRHNTRELNKLVEQIKEEVDIPEEETINYEVPILESIDSVSASVDEMLEKTGKINTNDINAQYNTYDIEPKKVEESIEVLEYTDAVPDMETAKKELKKMEEQLEKEEKLQEESLVIEDRPTQEADNNIRLTDYEEEQEKTAIISLEELAKKEKELYEANEVTQYMDEGNEPISLQDLEMKMDKKASVIEDTFVIENVVPEKELEESMKKELEENNSSRFKSSPIISPIYGIENINNKEMELENTANYEKLDQELKKTNEFLMSLKELQGKLD